MSAERLVDEKGSARRSRRRVFTGSQGERMHFSRSSEVLYFHSGSVSVHTDSHTDLERYVGCLPGAIYGNIRERERERESRAYRWSVCLAQPVRPRQNCLSFGTANSR